MITVEVSLFVKESMIRKAHTCWKYSITKPFALSILSTGVANFMHNISLWSVYHFAVLVYQRLCFFSDWSGQGYSSYSFSLTKGIDSLYFDVCPTYNGKILGKFVNARVPFWEKVSLANGGLWKCGRHTFWKEGIALISRYHNTNFQPLNMITNTRDYLQCIYNTCK